MTMTSHRHHNAARAYRGLGSSPWRSAAFTLIEMIVVVAVILIILGLTLPAITSMWDQRKFSEAENTIQGLLMTSRARALQAGGVDSGLLFFVDDQGIQRIVSIEQAKPGDLAWQNVFHITPDRDFTLPVPMRAVPRYVVDSESGGEPWNGFNVQELANNDFNSPVTEDVGQRHRNFFTIVYSSNGRLLYRRDVLIQDVDEDRNAVGDVTSLHVGVDMSDPDVTQYWPQHGDARSLDPTGLSRTVPALVTDGDDVAINFPSVDGLLVYDDSLFNEAGAGASAGEQKRAYLLRIAQPFYVNRMTGAVIRGPAGENVAP